MEEKTKNELYRILGLLDIQIEMIEAWLSGKQVLAPRKCGVTTAKQAKELIDFISQELDRAREEGRREVYEAIVFDKNIPHDVTTFVAAHLWKNMRDKAKEELSKLKDNK